jgi:hypothetical protein
MFQPEPQAHLWYPPQWVYEDAKDMADFRCEVGRGAKLCKQGKLSIMSTGVESVLKIMQQIQ